MTTQLRHAPALLATVACTPAALAQFQIDWFTIDGGGGTSIGAAFILSGTIGQHDAGSSSGGGFLCEGGYWPGAGAACYANCDQSTAAPVLNVADFTCFLQRYASTEPYANCDGSTAPPTLNVADFTCFLQKYAAGCV